MIRKVIGGGLMPVCPKCRKIFVYRKDRRCPHCGFLIVKLGESFVVDENQPFGLIMKVNGRLKIEVVKIQGKRLIMKGESLEKVRTYE